MLSGLGSSDSGSRAPTPTYRATLVTSKSAPSIYKGGEWKAQTAPGLLPLPVSKQQSEPALLQPRPVVDTLKALSLTHLGREWSVVDQPLTFSNTLSREYLRKIYKFEKPSELCFVNVSGKKLVHIDKKSLKPFTNVVYVDAGDNNLPFECFSCFPRLKELILPLNNISYFSVQILLFEHLQILDLSFNKLLISSVHGLGHLPSLYWLNLSHNNLERLPSSMSHKFFPRLEYLILDDNRLGKTHDFLYLCRLPKLKMLSMDHNRVFRVPVIDTLKSERRNEVTVMAMLSQEERIFNFPARIPTETRTMLRSKRTCTSNFSMEKCTDSHEWRSSTLKSSKSSIRRWKAKIPGSRLLLRHLNRTHMHQGVWPLRTELLNALMSGVQIPPQHRTVIHDPNRKCPLKQQLSPIESDVSQLIVGDEMSDLIKAEETLEETSDSSSVSSHVSTSTLASAVVNEVMERISHVSSMKSELTGTDSNFSKSKSSGTLGSKYEPAGEIPSGMQSDDTHSASTHQTNAISDNLLESPSANVPPSTTKSSLGKSMTTATSDISSHKSVPLSEFLSKSPVSSLSKSNEKSIKSDDQSSEQTGSKPYSMEAEITAVFRKLPGIQAPDRDGDSFSTRITETSLYKPIFVYDASNNALPFPSLQQLSLAGNKIECIEDVLAVKTWHKVTELSIKGNSAMLLPQTKLSVMKQQMVPDIKKKLVTYRFTDREVDPFYKKKLVSKLNPVEIRECPCHMTQSKILTPTHRFFNLDVTQPTPPGMVSLPIPTLRICQYTKTVNESLAAYRDVFRQMTNEESLTFDPISAKVPFSLREILFPFHHFHDHRNVTSATSFENSSRCENLEWRLTKSIPISYNDWRLNAGGAVECIVNDALIEHMESHVKQVIAKREKGDSSSVSSGKTVTKSGFYSDIVGNW